MDIEGQTALVTSARRGLGRHLAEQLRGRRALCTQPPETLTGWIQGAKVQLDVTDQESIARAAEEASGGVSILINNAGSSTRSPS